MELNTVIFDMDGLLIDSEPLWNEAASGIFEGFGLRLSEQQYGTTTGLRTREFLIHWFGQFGIAEKHIPEAELRLTARVIELVKQRGKPMPGVSHIFDLFEKKGFKIGLASSSPPELIAVVTDILNIGGYLGAVSSAGELVNGKPHPQVYLDCAEKLAASPLQCLCFEDSCNGMIAAKAARMKCVIVPSVKDMNRPEWGAADLKIPSLQNFSERLLGSLQNNL